MNATDPANAPDAPAVGARVDRGVMALRDDNELLHMRDHGGCTLKQIADFYGVSEAAASRWIKDARTRMLASPVAQRPEQDQQRAHNAGDAEVVPQERQVSNLRQSSDSSPDAACVLASAPGAASVCTGGEEERHNVRHNARPEGASR